MATELARSTRAQTPASDLPTMPETNGCLRPPPASHVQPPGAPDAGPILQGASHHPGPPLLYQMACEQCGAWASSELIGPDGAGEGDDGGFYCTSCRFGDEEADEGLGDSDLAIHERIINRSQGDRSG